jgi:hypothetical protein
VVSAVLMVAVGVALFDVHIVWRMLPAAFGTLLLGAACFCALGIAVAALVPNGEAAPGRRGPTFTVRPVVVMLRPVLPHGRRPRLAPGARLGVSPVKHFALALGETDNPFGGGTAWRWDHLPLWPCGAIAGVQVAVRKFQWGPALPARPPATMPALASGPGGRT